jgi:hypothetical protein|tara:strand:- start:90 stop:338 length:249 start_codon:yes stop_codon:yes gene_type:complete
MYAAKVFSVGDLKKMGLDFLNSIAMSTVKVEEKDGEFSVLYLSPSVGEMVRLNGLSWLDAWNLKRVVETRLALQYGAPPDNH